MNRRIYCPNCGTKINYVFIVASAGTKVIDKYPQCPKCGTYIYLVVTTQDYIVRHAKIEMVNCL